MKVSIIHEIFAWSITPVASNPNPFIQISFSLSMKKNPHFLKKKIEKGRVEATEK